MHWIQIIKGSVELDLSQEFDLKNWLRSRKENFQSKQLIMIKESLAETLYKSINENFQNE